MRNQHNILLTMNGVTLAAAFLWLIFSPGWDSFVAFLALLAIFAGLFYTKAKPTQGSIEIRTYGNSSPGIVQGDFVINQTTVNQYREVQRKNWRPLAVGRWATLAEVSEENSLSLLSSDMADALHETYGNKGYTAFTALLSGTLSKRKGHTVRVYEVTCHKAPFCNALEHSRREYLARLKAAKQRGHHEQEKQKILDELASSPLQGWRIESELLTGKTLQAVNLRLDPDAKHIAIKCFRNSSTNLAEYPEHLRRTSELLEWLAATLTTKVVDLGDVQWLMENYRMQKLLFNLLDNKVLYPAKIRVNVTDDEEWDYVNPKWDAEVRGIE